MPTVSIIVNNYNYARFVRSAIDSALVQTWPATEVVVVDDGSTDQSREIIAAYGDRIRAVFKKNGGQASAFKAGVEHSRGEIILFLDADDVLYPECAERVARAWSPATVKLQYRLDTIDADGANLAIPFPHYPEGLDAAAIRRQALTTGFYSWPVTSGNAFARRYLLQCLPVPETFRNTPDGYLSMIAPLFGDVAVLRAILGAYRVHGGNYWASTDSDAPKYAMYAAHDLARHAAFVRLARERGFTVPDDAILKSIKHVEARILSLKLTPEEHPVPGDRMLGLVRHGVASAFAGSSASVMGRALWSGWLVAMAILPAGVVWWIVRQARTHGRRTGWARLLVSLSRGSSAAPAPRESLDRGGPR